jgi:hypothetical protein
VTVKDVATAPIIYFDMAPNFGCNHGIVNVTLSVSRCLATDDGGVARDVVAVAHLRGSINAAMSLRKAIDDALLLGRPTGDGGKTN